MAIIGIGTDILEVKRIADILSKGDGFLKRVFTENECAYLKTRGMKPESVAAFWCAKEAVSKALGTGIRGFQLKDIEISHSELGKPLVILHGPARLIANNLGIGNIQLSLSHSDLYAVAFCTAE